MDSNYRLHHVPGTSLQYQYDRNSPRRTDSVGELCSTGIIWIFPSKGSRINFTKEGILRTAFLGCMRMTLYSEPGNGRSCSNAPPTNMMRPEPSSKDAMCIVAEFEIFSVHRTNKSARLADIPTHLDRSMSSNPTHTQRVATASFVPRQGNTNRRAENKEE